MRIALFCLVAAAAMAACAADPPSADARAAKAEEKNQSRAVALNNPGFEKAPRKSERCPEGWHCTMHSDPDSFVFRIEALDGAQGKQALCVERVTHEPWALVTQALPGASLHGTKLRFSLSVRIDRADGAGAGPWAVVHGATGNLVHEERLLTATKGWERIAVEFPVGAQAQIVEVGATMQGGGRVCFDEARLEIRAP
ncbi:MAG: hypothetical protein ABIR98_16235, partial [Usitatibacter sp.]